MSRSQIYYIQEKSQFVIENQILISLSKETIKDLASLPLTNEIFIKIQYLNDVVSIGSELFQSLPESILDKLFNQCCGIVINDMPNLIDIETNVFECIGSNYQKEFCFDILKCPRLENIYDSAFARVAHKSKSLVKYYKSNTDGMYILSFSECPSLVNIEDQAFAQFAYFAQNVICIDFSNCHKFDDIEPDAFMDAFSKSNIKFIKFSKLDDLRKLKINLFEQFIKFGNDFSILFSNDK